MSEKRKKEYDQQTNERRDVEKTEERIRAERAFMKFVKIYLELLDELYGPPKRKRR
ncbi:MAG: hypothetical protein FWF46_07865 [Oscillospiraceae bacterium]|nr:hypothetical protein [Oscillospiraceae bacterium]